MNSRTGIIKAFLVCTLLAAAAGPPALADYREDLAAAEQAYRMGDLNAVLYRLDRVVEDPDAPDDMRARALLDRAIFLSRQRARDRALKDYEKILARDPKNLDARINRARLLSQAGRLLEAIALLDQAASYNPEIWIISQNRGAYQFTLGDCGKVLEDFGRAASLAPEGERYLAVNAKAALLASCPRES